MADVAGDGIFDVLLPEVYGEGTERGGIANLEVPCAELSIRCGATLNIEVPPPTVTGTATAPIVGTAHITVPLISLSATTGGVASVTPPVAAVVGTGLVGTVADAGIRVPLAQIDGTGHIPLIGAGSVTVPLVTVNATGHRQNVANAGITVPRIDVDASGVVGTLVDGSVIVPLAQVTAAATFAPHGSAAITVPLASAEGFGTESNIPLTANAAITVPLVVVEGTSGEVIIAEQFTFFDPATIAVNINISNMMVSEYFNYKFNSQTYFDGKYIGANADGLFELSGENDAGTDIAARIRSGLDDLGSYHLKRVWGVYLAHNGEALRIKTTSPSEDFGTVGGAKNRATVSVQKFKVQRTKRDVYWGVQVENEGGSDFTIEGLEMICEILNRRAV